MKFIDEDNLPIEIKNNKLPKDQDQKYKLFYDEKIRTSGGFTDVIFLVSVMITCLMWGMLIIIAMK